MEAGKLGCAVHTNAYGEVTWENYFESETIDEFKGACVVDDINFAVVGTSLNEENNTPADIIVVMLANCNYRLPRKIWMQDSWRYQEPNNSNNYQLTKRDEMILLDDVVPCTNGVSCWQDKANRFIQLCKELRISTVILGHLEDIVREDNGTFSNYQDHDAVHPLPIPTILADYDGTVLRQRLKLFIQMLHNGGVDNIYAQVRDREIGPGQYDYTYTYDEPNVAITNNTQILNALCSLNRSVADGGLALGFDGLLLDYEYFAPDYGNASPNWVEQFGEVKDGWDHWKTLADAYIDKRYKVVGNNKNYYRLRAVDCYVSRIVFMMDIHTSTNNGFTNGKFDINSSGATTLADSRLEIDIIDEKGFNQIAHAYFIEDKMDGFVYNGTNRRTPWCPTNFLKSDPLSNGDLSNPQLYRWAMLLFGNDHEGGGTPRKTRISPEFWPQEQDGLNCANPTGDTKFGDVLLQQCYWSTHAWPLGTSTIQPHFLPEIEQEYVSQFNDYTGSSDFSTDPTVNDAGQVNYQWWGNVSVFGGFYYHQYGNGNTSLNVLDLPTRTGDRTQATIVAPYIYCTALRKPKTNKSIETQTNYSIVPNPFIDQVTISTTELKSSLNLKLFDSEFRELNAISRIGSNVKGSNQVTLSFNQLTNGIYFLGIIDEEKTSWLKIIKSN
ncbi:MAG: T9SS type A sorting domain-containing protein [Bacteroidetes bacterium]|nr:T9SS type A sorting domain-containing protein [Bacteroidota bacterium]